jgi:L-2-hydroxyglutarate oxidase
MTFSSSRYDVAVVGAGIVGLTSAMALASGPRRRLVVLEAEDEIARHQTGRNSGVIHSGLYYAPGSLKARLCTEGRSALERFCGEHGVPFERCGKLVLAVEERELPRLDELERRGRANGLAGLRRLGPAEIREREPHARGLAGLWVPETGIVEFAAVARAMAEQIRAAGGEIVTGARVVSCRARAGGEIALETAAGGLTCRALIACAGLHADRVARLCGVEPGVRIIPFRGEYRQLRPARRSLVRNLIYPVPDPRFPFLGVHLTRRPSGAVEAGPSAVLALKREGYERSSFSLADTAEMMSWPGFWRMGARHLGTAFGEGRRAGSTGAFAAALRRLVPEIEPADLVAAPAGVRAMAVGRDGTLIEDFQIAQSGTMVHVLSAPSPAATASIAIGRWIAGRLPS